MAHDVFISYSSKDVAYGEAICAALERAGLSCWMAPRDIVPGVGWAKSIIQAINGARAMVLVVSSQSNDSPQVEREVERAVNKGIPIVPFRIENVPLGDALEYFLSAPHWLEAYNPPLEPHLERLTAAVRTLLGSGAGRREMAKPSLPADPPPRTKITDPVEPPAPPKAKPVPPVAKPAPQKAAGRVPEPKAKPVPAAARRWQAFPGMAGQHQRAMLAGVLTSLAAVIAILGAGAVLIVEVLPR